MSSDDDSVEPASFEVRVGHGQDRLILALRSNLEGSFGGVNIHVVSPFFEINPGEEFLISLFVDYVHFTNIRGSMNYSHLSLIGRRRRYVVIDDRHRSFVVSARHNNNGVVSATT